MNDDQHQPEENSSSEANHNCGSQQGPKTALEQRQEMLAHHVRLVTRKLSHALFIFGPTPGIGKTMTVMKTLEEENVTPVLLNSHITPLAMYEMMYNHREGATLFLDDVDSVLSSMPHLGLMRSALWGKPRTVTYTSSALPKHLPPRFDFESSMIICVNVVPAKQNAAFSAVVSRCDQFEMHATNDEIIDLMRSQSENGFSGITSNECEMVIDFIEESTTESDKQLSLRLLGPALRKYRYAREMNVDWRMMVSTQLATLGSKTQAVKRVDTKNRDLQIMRDVVEAHPDSSPDQVAAWCAATEKSRASFFRCLQRYRDLAEE